MEQLQQGSFLPEYVPHKDVPPKFVVINKNHRSMHNFNVFVDLMTQIEEVQIKEMNRLTTDCFVWRVLSFMGILPKRRAERYGYFIK